MKTNLNHVIFSDECCTTLDVPDVFSRGFIGNNQAAPIQIKRHNNKLKGWKLNNCTMDIFNLHLL